MGWTFRPIIQSRQYSCSEAEASHTLVNQVLLGPSSLLPFPRFGKANFVQYIAGDTSSRSRENMQEGIDHPVWSNPQAELKVTEVSILTFSWLAVQVHFFRSTHLQWPLTLTEWQMRHLTVIQSVSDLVLRPWLNKPKREREGEMEADGVEWVWWRERFPPERKWCQLLPAAAEEIPPSPSLLFHFRLALLFFLSSSVSFHLCVSSVFLHLIH